MNKERAKVLLGALQMIEPLIGSDELAINAFCLLWNELSEIAQPMEANA